MLQYPEINPIALSLGPVKIHWYGLMYLIGIAAAWVLGVYRAKKPNSGWTSEQVSDLIFYGALGVILGGRLGYVIFYDLSVYLAHPLTIFAVWDGGMSFHGGCLGVAIAGWLYGKKIKKDFLTMMDFAVPLVPIGLGMGRLGNFINGELWGRVTDVPWAMVFPTGGPYPRHPSQLYEFFLEGLLLFIIIWFFSAKPRPKGAVSGLFFIGYGVFRFIVEFFRQPDPQLGYVAFGWLTRGQELCIPMIVIGALVFFWAYKNKKRSKL